MLSKDQAHAVAHALAHQATPSGLELGSLSEQRELRPYRCPELDELPLGQRLALVRQAKKSAWRKPYVLLVPVAWLALGALAYRYGSQGLGRGAPLLLFLPLMVMSKQAVVRVVAR